MMQTLPNMTPEQATNQEWKRHYEDMRNQRDEALKLLKIEQEKTKDLQNQIYADYWPSA